jgi:hypothetical protein
MKTPGVDLDPILKKYKGIKLFKEGQDQFKEEFFKELFDPYEPVNYSRRTTLFINAILDEEDLPYIFSVDYEDFGKNKGKKYWKLVEL